MSLSEFAAVCHPGRRPLNEDAIFRSPRQRVYAVADGMGGPGVGDVAAKVALASVEQAAEALQAQLERVEAAPSESTHRLELGRQFEAVFDTAHEAVRQHAAAQRSRRMAAALLAAVVGRSSAYIAHVGNCRAYLLRGGTLIPLTEDHSVAQAQLRHGRLRPEDLAQSPDRFRLYQAVGANADMDVETAEVPLASGDTLLLCSDGLTANLSDEEIAHYLTLPPVLEDAARALAEAALAAGGEDNLSLILLRVGEVPDQGRVEAISQALRRVFLFRDLSPAERYTIAPYMAERTLQRGEVLFREGEVADDFFLVLEGGLAVQRGQTPLATITTGGHLGELALARPTKRTTTATATAPTRLYALSRERFQQLVARRPHLGSRLTLHLLDTVGERLRELGGRFEEVSEEAGELRRRLELVERAARGDLRVR